MTSRPPARPASEEASRQLRGSSLLLAGRLLAMVIALGTQVLIVNALTKADYGLFAFGLATVSSVRIIVSFGDTQSVGRFLAMYDESEDHARFVGTLALVLAKIVVSGVVVVTAVMVGAEWFTTRFVADDADATVFAVLMLLAPLEAVGAALGSLFAVRDRVGLVLVRRYLWAPLVRFALVGWLALAGGGVRLLAVGYVLGELIGVVTYALLARRELPGGRSAFRDAVRPTGDYLRFALPAGSVELVSIVMTTVTVLVLGWFHGAESVADYRAVFPIGRLNQMALLTFTVLFTPMAARLFRRADLEGMEAAYWQTASYLMVLTFPIFAVSVPLANATVPLLFGEEYRSAALTLAVLGGAYFLHSAFGYNAQVLQTFGHVRWVVVSNGLAIVVTLGLAAAVVPAAGAVGVSWCILGGLGAQNLVNQYGLRRLLGFRLLGPQILPLLGWIVALAAGLYGLEEAGVPLAVLVLASVVATAALVRGFRSSLALDEVFPELRRVPVIRRLLAP